MTEKLTKDRLDKLASVIKSLSQPAIILITQVDPDALGGSILLRYLLKNHFNCESRIIYAGDFDHPQNKSIVNFYSIGEYMESIDKFPSADLGNVILVDSSLKKDGRIFNKIFNPVIVIDHHEKSDIEQNGNNWIWRESVGASTTLVAELALILSENKIGDYDNNTQKNEQQEEEWRIVATISALGITSDTHHFTEKIDRKRDRKMWNGLMDYASSEEYGILSNFDLPQRYFELLSQVTNEKNYSIMKEATLVARTGLINGEEVAYLSDFAEMLWRMKGIQKVIIWAPVKNVGFSVKVRSDDASENISNFINELVSTGGGKSKKAIGSGGAIITVSPLLLPTESNEVEAIAFFDVCIKKKIEEVL